jgi:hypothetical protein
MGRRRGADAAGVDVTPAALLSRPVAWRLAGVVCVALVLAALAWLWR